MNVRWLVALGVAAMLGGTVAMAQSGDEMSAEEIRELLEQQTRGLTLAPSGDAAAGGGAEIREDGYAPVAEDVRIDIPIVFDFDSASIRADQRPRLETVCEAVRASTVPRLQIIGHTDASGSAAYNASLSKLRAEEVKRFLVDDCGIEPSRLEAVGVGEDFPANADDPRADENRRVEFQALS